MAFLFPSFTASSGLADPAAGQALLEALIAFTVVVGALSALLALATVALRLFHNTREQSRKLFRERWEPLLFEAMIDPPAQAPVLSRGERKPFLELWMSVQSHIREIESENLNRLARALGLEADALSLIRSRSLENRLLGVNVLATLRTRAAWDDIERLIHSKIHPLALRAAHALVRIDPARAFPGVVPVLRPGREWAPVQVAQILREGAEHALEALSQILDRSQPAEAQHLIRLLSLLHNTVILPLLRERMRRGTAPEELAEILYALGRLGGPADLERVAGHLGHEHWLVRMKAAQAIGQIGTSGDDVRLIPLLSDQSWWVRYRAAQSLMSLPGMSDTRLRAIREGLTDRYGRDIMTQVLAENGAAA